jgi:hypothetical protein
MEHFSSFQQTQALPKPGEFIAGVEVCQLEPTLSYICQLFEYLTIFADHKSNFKLIPALIHILK